MGDVATYLCLLLSSQAFLQRIRQNVADSVEKGLTEENVKVRTRPLLLLLPLLLFRLALLLPSGFELLEFRGLLHRHCLPPTPSLLSTALEGLPWEGQCTPGSVLEFRFSLAILPSHLLLSSVVSLENPFPSVLGAGASFCPPTPAGGTGY